MELTFSIVLINFSQLGSWLVVNTWFTYSWLLVYKGVKDSVNGAVLSIVSLYVYILPLIYNLSWSIPIKKKISSFAWIVE